MGEDDKPGEMSLRVAEINKASAGRGLCSAGIHIARRLNIKAGEIVEISGQKTTACIFFPNSEDEGKQIIHVDGLVRLNAGTELGKIVKMRKARPEPAKRVVFAPINTKGAFQPRKIRDSLMNRPLVKGDNMALMNMAIPVDRPATESKEDKMENLPWPFPPFAGKRKRNYMLGELRLVVVETTPEESIVQITPPTVVEIKEGTVIVPGYSSIIDQIKEAIQDVHDELQEFLKEYSRSSFESFLSNIGYKSKNQDPLLDAPHQTGMYFILLREEMDFLSGKPFYIGYARDLNKRMHDLFPDENGKYQHELSARMLEDVLKRGTSQPVFDSCDDYTTFLKDKCDFWFSTTGEANDQQALATASMLRKMLDQLLEPCIVWNKTNTTECEQRMQDFRERTRAAFYATP